MAAYKLSPLAHDGDIVSVTFSYEAELEAFRHVMEKMAARVQENKPREMPILDFPFDTAIEMEVAGYYAEKLRKIIGLERLRVIPQSQRAIITPLPEQTR